MEEDIFCLFDFPVYSGSDQVLRLFQELTERIARNREYSWRANLVPFASIRTQLGHMTQWWAVKNVVGNMCASSPGDF